MDYIAKSVVILGLTITLASCTGEDGRGIVIPRAPVAVQHTATPDPNRNRGRISAPANGLPDLVSLAEQAWEANNDAIGWLRVPNTHMDEAVYWKPGDNDYYLRRDSGKRYSYNGVFYADRSASFGSGSADGLGRNTVIYGHSMSDSKNDVKMGPIRFFLEEDFARANPYINFSTLRDDLLWEVIAVFYTDIHLPYNISGDDEDAFAIVIEQITKRSIFDYGYEYSPDDRFLTLSTCVYSLPDRGVLSYPNDYRLCLMARLVGEGEGITESASIKWNMHIMPA